MWSFGDRGAGDDSCGEVLSEAESTRTEFEFVGPWPVTITTPRGTEFELHITNNTTVHEMRDRACDLFHCWSGDQHFWMTVGGLVLPWTTAKDCGLQPGCTIVLHSGLRVAASDVGAPPFGGLSGSRAHAVVKEEGPESPTSQRHPAGTFLDVRAGPGFGGAPPELPAWEPIAEHRWGSLLRQSQKDDLANKVDDLMPTSWLQDVHVDALLTQAFLQAWDARCEPPVAHIMEACQAACLGDAGSDTIERASATLIAEVLDWTKYGLVCIPLNTPGAGGGHFAGTHWSLLVYYCEQWPLEEGIVARVRACHFDSSAGCANAQRSLQVHQHLRTLLSERQLSGMNFDGDVAQMSCQKQVDGHSCGDFVSFYAYAAMTLSVTAVHQGKFDPAACRSSLIQLVQHLVVCKPERADAITPRSDTLSLEERRKAEDEFAARGVRQRQAEEERMLQASVAVVNEAKERVSQATRQTKAYEGAYVMVKSRFEADHNNIGLGVSLDRVALSLEVASRDLREARRARDVSVDEHRAAVAAHRANAAADLRAAKIVVAARKIEDRKTAASSRAPGRGKTAGGPLAHASAGMRADKDVVLAAVQCRGAALQVADASLGADKEVVLAAVTDDGEALEFASEALRNDKEVCLAAVSRRPTSSKAAFVLKRPRIAAAMPIQAATAAFVSKRPRIVAAFPTQAESSACAMEPAEEQSEPSARLPAPGDAPLAAPKPKRSGGDERALADRRRALLTDLRSRMVAVPSADGWLAEEVWALLSPADQELWQDIALFFVSLSRSASFRIEGSRRATAWSQRRVHPAEEAGVDAQR